MPHYWLGMVLVIVFSATLGWLPPTGAGPGGSGGWTWDWEHLRYLILPAVTMSVIPMGIIARTVRALVADILSQEFIVRPARQGPRPNCGVFRHVVKNAAPTALAVMGLQLGYLLGGSILIETVFSWPGTGFLLNAAIFQRDLPLLQGTILVLAMFFVLLNLVVDVAADGARSAHPAELSTMLDASHADADRRPPSRGRRATGRPCGGASGAIRSRSARWLVILR